MSQTNEDIPFCFHTMLIGIKFKLPIWAAITIVGCIGALVIAVSVGKRTYVSKAILSFQPVEVTSDSVSKEALHTFKDSVKLETILSQVRKNLKLEMKLDKLGKSCDVKLIKRTTLLVVECKSDVSEQALQITTSIVENFLDWQVDQRSQVAKRKIDGHNIRLLKIKSSLALLENKAVDLQRSFLSINLEQESQRLLGTLGELKLKLEVAKIEKNSSISKKSSLQNILLGLKKKEKSKLDNQVQMEQLSDVSIRAKRLRENIKDNQLYRWHHAKVRKLQSLYDRQKKLHTEGLVPLTTLESTKGELESAKAYVEESTKTTKWKKELTKLDKVVIPTKNNTGESSALLKEVMMKDLEIDLNRSSTDKTIQHFEKMIDKIEETLKELSQSNQKLKLINRDIDTLIKERDFIDDQRKQLLILGSCSFSDFVYVSHPEKAIYPKKSTYRLIAILFGVLSLALGLVIILAMELLDRSIHSKKQVLKVLSLNTLGELKRKSTHKVEESDISIISSKLRTKFCEYGQKSFLFSTNRDGDGMSKLINSLGVSLGRMGCKVLILEVKSDVGAMPLLNSLTRQITLCSHSTSFPGLSNYLDSSLMSLEEIVIPTSFNGLSLVKIGDTRIHRDALYSSKLDQAMSKLKNEFDIVLIDCDPMSQSNDFRALTRLSDATVLMIKASCESSSDIKKDIEKLVEEEVTSIEVILNDVQDRYYSL